MKGIAYAGAIKTLNARKMPPRIEPDNMAFFSRVRYCGIKEASASWSLATENVADVIETGGITR